MCTFNYITIAYNYLFLNIISYTALIFVIFQIQNVDKFLAVGTTLREVKTALLNDWCTVMMYRGEYM